MLRKSLSFILAAVFVAGMFAGCGRGNETPPPEPTPTMTPSPSPEGSAPPEDESTVSIIIKDEKLKAAYEAVRKEFGEFYVASPAVVNEQQMKELYYINPEDIEEFVGEMSMLNVSGDTFIGVKCKPGKAGTVSAALNKRRDDIINTFKTYPVNFMDLKSEACEVVEYGDYAFMVLMGDINVPDGKEASLEMAQKEVERAVKCLDGVFKA